MKAGEPLGVGTLVHERYRIVAPIGRGGMGAVFEAVDERLGHRVALKQTLVEGQVAERAFEREARLLAGLRHPTLPVVSDSFEKERGRFLVMQFIPGRSLAETVQERAANDIWTLHRGEKEVLVLSGDQRRTLAPGRFRLVPSSPVLEPVEFEIKAGERSIVRPRELRKK